MTWTVNPSGDACLRSSLYTDTCLPLAAILILLRHNIKSMFKFFLVGWWIEKIGPFPEAVWEKNTLVALWVLKLLGMPAPICRWNESTNRGSWRDSFSWERGEDLTTGCHTTTVGLIFPSCATNLICFFNFLGTTNWFRILLNFINSCFWELTGEVHQIIFSDLRSELSRGRLALAVGYAAEEFFNTEIMPLLVKLERENRTDQRSLTIGEVATYMRPYLQITKQLNDVLSTIIKVDFV